MVDVAIALLLQNVNNLFSHSAPVMGKPIARVETLISELELLIGAIKDMSSDPDPNHEQKALLNNVRKAVDRAEDIVDDFIIQKAKKNSLTFKLIPSFYYASSVREIEMEIRKIRQVADKMTQRMTDEWQIPKRPKDGKYGINKVPVAEEEDVIGFDEPAKEVISWLRNDYKELDVIGIVGMPGIGKTTLANKVYKDERIDYDFIHRAWAYVSMDCQVHDVFLSIFKQLANAREDADKMTTEELSHGVRQILIGRRYLIVLDDVCTTETWDLLKVAFPNNNNGSRILLTTQNMVVAEHANLNRSPYRLKFLTEDESLELLVKRVFGKSECPDFLMESGKLIAERCGGLPLAIVIISGDLLPRRMVKAWWAQVAERVNAFVIKDEKWSFDVVSHNYNSLPSNLKSCFLYFGLFPKGTVRVSQLIRLWISEGFIQDEDKLGLENEARALLDDLVYRSLVIPISRRLNGEIRTCRVHDTLHEFCKHEAEMQGSYQDINTSNVGLYNNYRRICVDPNDKKLFSMNSIGDQVHTVLTILAKNAFYNPRETQKMVKVFKRIRILEASSIKFLRFPKELQELVLLRYLAFSCNVNSIPSTISNLFSLQTLIILTSKSVISFPKEIWKLYQLRHLKTNASALLPEPTNSGIKGQNNVQTLSTIAPESCTKKVFDRVPDVKKLGIRGKHDLIFGSAANLIDNLGQLEQLTNLKILCDPTSGSIVQTLSEKFPKVVKRVTKLTISGTSLGWESMSVLGEMERLEVLKLKNAFIGDQWNANWGIFPSLRSLDIEKTDLKFWEASKEQFLKLSSLFLRDCDKLVAVPAPLADLQSFQNLEVYDCKISVARSAREIQAKKYKVHNVVNSQGLKVTISPPDM